MPVHLAGVNLNVAHIQTGHGDVNFKAKVEHIKVGEENCPIGLIFIENNSKYSTDFTHPISCMIQVDNIEAVDKYLQLFTFLKQNMEAKPHV